MDRQAAQDDRRRRRPRNAKREGRHHRPAGRRIVRGFWAGDAFNLACAELVFVLRPALRLVIADHCGHRAARRQHADEGPDSA